MAQFDSKKSIFGYNKNSLSWSAYNTWVSSKDQYRLRYYGEERPSFQTPETIFGNKIGKYLEEGHDEVKHVEQYPKPEHRLSVIVDGVKLIGYLDSFDPKQNRFLEYKTSHKNKHGKHYWNALKVAKHRQLDFYSLLIQEKYGKVQDKCKLIYLETEQTTIKYKGRVYEPADKGLRLSGKMEVFERSIKQWERDAMKKRILKVAKEIKEDYETFRKNN